MGQSLEISDKRTTYAWTAEKERPISPDLNRSPVRSVERRSVRARGERGAWTH
ncbi:hypothetical protein NQZ68_007577 [Dissostichus eleginoides]|nr:hypothetical protein NQZ68_007577 [Dissostichus eleginoides]